ncbi:MAG: WD40 repeat domain-containing protein [Chloroflexota bacterium]
MNTPDASFHLSLKHTFAHQSKRRIWLVVVGAIMMLVGIWLMLITVQAVAQRELYCERATDKNNCVLRLKWLGVPLTETTIDVDDVILAEVDGLYQILLVTDGTNRPLFVAQTTDTHLQPQVDSAKRFFNWEGDEKLYLQQGGDWQSLSLGILGSVLMAAGLFLGIFSYRVVSSPTHHNLIESLAFAPSGEQFASASWDKTIQVWDVNNLDLRMRLNGHTGPVVSLVFSPDDQQLISGSGDHTVRIWQLADGTALQTLKDAGDAITDLSLSPNGTQIAAGSWDLFIYIWDISTGQLLHRLAGHEGTVESLVFTPDNQTLISASADQTIRFWQMSDGLCTKSIELPCSVTSLAISPDGDYLVSGSIDHLIRVWSLPDGELEQTLDEHTDWIRDLDFSPDGLYLVSASRDGTVRFWSSRGDILTLTNMKQQGEVTSIAVSPDSQLVVTSTRDQMVRLWEVEL